MSTIELKERLIEKIQETNDDNILEEAYRLLELEATDTAIYKFSESQKTAIETYRLQIKEGKFLSNDEANKDIEEWLNK